MLEIIRTTSFIRFGEDPD